MILLPDAFAKKSSGMEVKMKILFEDNNLIICIKPIGILSQRDDSGNANMVIY